MLLKLLWVIVNQRMAYYRSAHKAPWKLVITRHHFLWRCISESNEAEGPMRLSRDPNQFQLEIRLFPTPPPHRSQLTITTSKKTFRFWLWVNYSIQGILPAVIGTRKILPEEILNKLRAFPEKLWLLYRRISVSVLLDTQ